MQIPDIDVEEYFRTYGPMVLRRCRSLLKDEGLAEDAMQDTFVQLLKNRHKLRDEAPSSLLYTMATNICLNRIRSTTRRPESTGNELVDKIAGFQEPDRPVFANIMLDRIFAGEQASTRTIAMLHLVDGLTLEETANTVGLSVSGVRKRLRGLKSRAGMFERGEQ